MAECGICENVYGNRSQYCPACGAAPIYVKGQVRHYIDVGAQGIQIARGIPRDVLHVGRPFKVHARTVDGDSPYEN